LRRLGANGAPFFARVDPDPGSGRPDPAFQSEMGADRLMFVCTSRRRVLELVAVADHDPVNDVNEDGPWSLTLTLT
jgi:hypothetical protein